MEPLLGPVSLTRIPAGGGWYDALGAWRDVQDRFSGFDNTIDWVIVGGESGTNARPMHPDWVRSLRDQCTAAGVPFLFKQYGEWTEADACDAATGDAMYDLLDVGRYCVIGHDGDTHCRDAAQVSQPSVPLYRVGKKAAGRLLDGRTWDEFPERLI
jgi:hypothetical protein